jgi:hypothetical protein
MLFPSLNNQQQDTFILHEEKGSALTKVSCLAV